MMQTTTTTSPVKSLSVQDAVIQSNSPTNSPRSPRASELFYQRKLSLASSVKPPDQIFNTDSPYLLKALSVEKLVEKVVTQQGGYEELLKLTYLAHHVFLSHTELFHLFQKHFTRNATAREWICDILLQWMNEYSGHWISSSDLVNACLQFIERQIPTTEDNAGGEPTTVSTTTVHPEVTVVVDSGKTADEHYIHKFVSDVIQSLSEEYTSSEESSSNNNNSSSGSNISSTAGLLDEIVVNKLELMKVRLAGMTKYHDEHFPTFPLAMEWNEIFAGGDDEDDEYIDDDDDEDEEELEMPSETKFEWTQYQQQLAASFDPQSWEGLRLLDWPVKEFAIQITLIDAELFCRIESWECVSQDYHAEELRKAPNIALMIDRFDSMASWVVQQILSEPDLKSRSNIVSKLIDLMRHLYQMDNYHSLMAIFSSLSNQAVFRLKKTMAGLTAQDLLFLKRMDTLLSPSKRFRALSKEMKYCEPPCLPYLGVLLSQLSAVQTCYDDKISVGDGVKLIHVNKFRLCSKVIAQLHSFQKYAKWYRASFTRVPYLYSTLMTQIYENEMFSSQTLLSEQFLEKSLLLEPRSESNKSE